ncbi:MAG: hypothetical protein JNK95_03695 [Candidatus Competibacter sp.]|nr:hypothetical protein [Candidatus Competibacter sp.]MDG4604745.1 hypothetical protein [Candidatus Contendobacter sp.]HRD48613.1 hypothetical protein [Candidatus Contendobacter sp.]
MNANAATTHTGHIYTVSRLNQDAHALLEGEAPNLSRPSSGGQTSSLRA